MGSDKGKSLHSGDKFFFGSFITGDIIIVEFFAIFHHIPEISSTHIHYGGWFETIKLGGCSTCVSTHIIKTYPLANIHLQVTRQKITKSKCRKVHLKSQANGLLLDREITTQ